MNREEKFEQLHSLLKELYPNLIMGTTDTKDGLYYVSFFCDEKDDFGDIVGTQKEVVFFVNSNELPFIVE